MAQPAQFSHVFPLIKRLHRLERCNGRPCGDERGRLWGFGQELRDGLPRGSHQFGSQAQVGQGDAEDLGEGALAQGGGSGTGVKQAFSLELILLIFSAYLFVSTILSYWWVFCEITPKMYAFTMYHNLN